MSAIIIECVLTIYPRVRVRVCEFSSWNFKANKKIGRIANMHAQMRDDSWRNYFIIFFPLDNWTHEGFNDQDVRRQKDEISVIHASRLNIDDYHSRDTYSRCDHGDNPIFFSAIFSRNPSAVSWRPFGEDAQLY